MEEMIPTGPVNNKTDSDNGLAKTHNLNQIWTSLFIHVCVIQIGKWCHLQTHFFPEIVIFLI